MPVCFDNWINSIKKSRFVSKFNRPEDRENPVLASCSQCGRELRRFDMYSCSRQSCPTQPKARL